MANGKKPKKGLQLGPDVKKAMNTAAETLAGPAYQGAKALYNYINPSKPIGDLNSVARKAKEIFTEGYLNRDNGYTRYNVELYKGL